uniref:Microphthalmia-associated transcription factor n=1 Tax=Meretrix petechialis TaxID=311198 RepID=A0A2R4PAJ1_9BIVA|nr:microphthalmia-associated transcription factor [Meretrix petechialis]
MSDNISCKGFQKYTNFLNDDHSGNYELFKQLLYESRGKKHTYRIDYSGFGKDVNRNGLKSSKRTPCCSTAQFTYGYGASDNAFENANRQTCLCPDQSNMEFSHFDEFDRISSCLIRLLGEAKEEHGKAERILANHHNVHLDDDLSAIEPSIQDSISTSDSNTDNRGDVFLDDDMSVSDTLQECPSASSDKFDTAFPTVKERVQSFKQRSLEYRTTCTDKKRKKKDNHNIVERRRRFHINDRIKELQTLLPYITDTNVRQNKGSVLKAAIEYIKKLRKEHERIEQMDKKIKQHELLCKKIITRMQKLEIIMKTKLLNQALSEVRLVSMCNATSSDTDTSPDSEDARPECQKETALTTFDPFNMQNSEATGST